MEYSHWCIRPTVYTTPVWQSDQFTAAEEYINGKLSAGQFFQYIGVSQEGDNLRVEFHMENVMDWVVIVEPGQEFIAEDGYFPTVRVITPQEKANWFPASQAPGAVVPS